MKRTTLMVDEALLRTAVRVMGGKTYSEVVNRALEEVIRAAKAEGILEYIGTGVWQGNLGEMREDYGSRPGKKKR